MTASGGTPTSKLLDMALDDVGKVMQKDRAIRKEGNSRRRDRGSRNDSRAPRSRNSDRGGKYWQRGPDRRRAPRPPSFIVKVSNLDYKVSKDDLMELFSSVGEVDKVWIDYDRTDRSMGTGGCIFKSEDDAKRAVSQHDRTEFSGRTIELSGEYQKIVRPNLRRQSDIGVKAPW